MLDDPEKVHTHIIYLVNSTPNELPMQDKNQLASNLFFLVYNVEFEHPVRVHLILGHNDRSNEYRATLLINDEAVVRGKPKLRRVEALTGLMEEAERKCWISASMKPKPQQV